MLPDKKVKVSRSNVKKLILPKQPPLNKSKPDLMLNPNIIPLKHQVQSFERYLAQKEAAKPP